MKVSKKLSLSVLSASFLLSTINSIDLGIVNNSYIAYAEEKSVNDQLSNVSKEQDNSFKDDDKVKVIVKLKENSVDPNQLTTKEGREAREESTKSVREEALEKISNSGIEYKKFFEYDLLFNGFSLETKYSDAKKIQSLDFVDSVELNVEYEAPTTIEETDDKKIANAAEKKAIDSSNIINVQPLWDKGIKGQGKVVAIIDSGIDPNHDILKISDTSTAKYKNEKEINDVKAAAGINYGKWYNDKLVFAFNYNDWDDNVKEAKVDSHGMHVTGSAVGNPSKVGPNGDYISGVAPEAQLLFMRVFSDKQSSGNTDSFIYVKAIEDAIKLGADTINMSLGSASGSVLEVGKAVSQAIELAQKAGVTVAIAAGNSNTFGNGYAKPSVANPDYGLVGNPSVAYDSISVAAITNSVLNTEAMQVKGLENNEEFSNGKFPMKSNATLFDPKLDYEYVYTGIGNPEDFEGKDVKGKVALIKRGAITFEDKVKNAKAAGAIGVIVFNHEAGGDGTIGMSLNGQDKDFPVISMGYKYGKELSEHADKYKLNFNGSFIKQEHSNKNKLTDFTSWGMSSDGQLKPDVTAPGGDIISSFNNGTYGIDSGTSMASPHVAGAVTLVKQALLQRFPNLTGEEMQKLVKHLVMSTAVPNYNETTKAYTSPREQGAGVVDTTKAALSDLYVTGENDYGSISLGNVGDTFTLNIVVHNISNEAKELVYTTYLNTDEAKDSYVTLNPRQLSETSGGEKVVVPANGELRLSIPVDASKFKSDLQGIFPNGYYLEGFVKFFDSKDNKKELVSIPYVGFRGDFQDLTVVEKSVYDFTGDNKPFYYYQDPKATDAEKVRDEANNFTHIVTSVKENGKDVLKVLGEYKDEKTGETSFTKLVFSPNNDEIYDEIAFKGVFLRNYENLKVTVYAKSDVNRTNPLYEAGNASGTKNYFDNNPKNPKSTMISASVWGGLDKNGKPLADGEYQYVVSYYPDVAGAKKQEQSFNVTIDRVAPKIEGTGGTYDEATRVFTPYKVTETGSGILYKHLIYTVKEKDEEGNDKDVVKYVNENKDGTYRLPEGIELESFKFTVGDYAGNKDEIQLTSLQKTEKGTIEVKILSEDSKNNYGPYGRYKITNEKGELVGEDFIKNSKTLKALPFGKYKVELILFDESLQLLTPKEVEVELTKDSATKEVEFKVKEVDSNTFEIKFDKDIPEGTTVTVISESGEKIVLPKAKYNIKSVQKKLPNGKYTVKINLPEGYSASENNFEYEVTNSHNQKDIKLNLAEKVTTVLTDESSVNKGSVVLANPIIYNDSKLVVNTISDASVLTKLNQELVTVGEDLTKYDIIPLEIHLERLGEVIHIDGSREVNLETSIKDAKVYHEEEDGNLVLLTSSLKDNKLTFTAPRFSNFVILTTKEQKVEPTKVDKESLKQELEKFDTIEASESYVYASTSDKENYQTKVIAAQKVFYNEDATQEEVDAVLASLKEVESKLTGKKPVVNKDDLKAEVAKESAIKASDKYEYATSEDKVEYDSALEKAKIVASKEDATQEEVDATLASLKEYSSKLNGSKVSTNGQEAPEVDQPTYELVIEEKLEKTEKEVEVQRKENADLEKGIEKVLQEGKAGYVEKTLEITKDKAGNVLSTKEKSIKEEAGSPKIVEVGTKEVIQFGNKPKAQEKVTQSTKQRGLQDNNTKVLAKTGLSSSIPTYVIGLLLSLAVVLRKIVKKDK